MNTEEIMKLADAYSEAKSNVYVRMEEGIPLTDYDTRRCDEARAALEAALSAKQGEPELIADLSMMVRRLVLSIRRLAEDDTKDLTFANACLDWLKHKGLAGSPLRDNPAPEAKQEAVATVIGEMEHDGQGWCSKVRWIYNPVPVGETLSWEQPK